MDGLRLSWLKLLCLFLDQSVAIAAALNLSGLHAKEDISDNIWICAVSCDNANCKEDR